MSHLKNGLLIINKDKTIIFSDALSQEIMELSESPVSKKFSEIASDTTFLNIIEKALESFQVESDEFSPSWNEHKRIFLKAQPFSTEAEDGLIVTMLDLTNLRRLEGLQREFVANVSHELRTPLTSIKMSAESLQLGAISDERMRNKFLSNIQREADRLTRLVNELLILANLDNKVTLHLSQFDPVELLSDVVTVMRHHADLNDITLVDDFPEDLPLMEADKDRIQQVLINLTDNAIKCNRQNGKVTLFARQNGNFLEVKVVDTGIGIQKVDLTRIFDRFFRVDKSRSRVTGGTGLGLSIVKDIIVAHGGNIHVESEIDVGTTFVILLPLSQSTK